MKVFLLALLLAGSAMAQRHKVNINTETPEGQMLQQIGQEGDGAKQLPMFEKFLEQYPKSENLAWVYSQMEPLYVKANQPDKAIEIGDKLIALDPEDLETALQTLKAAETKKDPDLVKKWSNTTGAIAQKVIATPQPKDEDEVEEWKKKMDYTKQVNTYSEYALYAMALQTQDPRKKVDLVDALEQRNPQSQYLATVTPLRFQAYLQLGDSENAAAAGDLFTSMGKQHRMYKPNSTLPQAVSELGEFAPRVPQHTTDRQREGTTHSAEHSRVDALMAGTLSHAEA